MKKVNEKILNIEKNYFHGNVNIDNYFKIPLDKLPLLIKNFSHEGVDLKYCCALDIETTYSENHTTPFLIGLLYPAQNDFVLHQIFITDLEYECEFLKTLSQIFEKFGTFITYNGTEFDLPVLEERFKFHNINCYPTSKKNIDALLGARKLWRRKLKRRNLITVEREILNVHRIGDIKSKDIPYAFLNDLEKNKETLDLILRHNFWDVLSTFSVLIRLGEILSVNESFLGVDEILTLGQICTSKSHPELANEFLQKLLYYPTWLPEVHKGLITLIKSLQKLNRRAEAIEVCKKLVEDENLLLETPRYYKFDPLPYELLATYYEQEAHNYEKAEEILSRAVGIAEKLNHQRTKKLQRRLAYVKNLIELKLSKQ